MSLKKKLIILFICFTLVPLVLFGAVVFSRARNILQTVRIAQLDTVTDLKRDKIETFFREREADIRSAQNYYNIRRNLPAISRARKGMAGPGYREVKQMLDDQLKTFQEASGYLDIMLLDPNGRIVYVSNPAHVASHLQRPFTDRKAFEEGRKGIYFTDVFLNETDGREFEMYGVAPVRDLQGNFAGEVVIEIDMVPIFKFIQDTTGLGTTGEALIAKREGDKTVFLNPLRHDPNAALTRTVDLHEKIAVPAIKAVQGENGSGMSYDYHGEEVLAAWRYIPFLRWGLVAKIDASEVFAPVRQLKAVVISVSLFMALIGTLAALAITRTITGPIVSLQKGAEAIAAGDLSHPVGTDSQDEIGRLSRAFDAMTDAIDKRVRERTQELETAVAERKEAEEILKLANAYNRSLLEASLDPLVTIDASGKIMDANNAAEFVTGVSRERLVGSDFSDYFTEPDKARQGYQKVFTVGFVKDYPLAIRHASGRITHVLYNAVVYKDEAGQVQGVFAAARDITERKKAEEAVRLASAYNRSLLEASLDPLVTIDASGRITDVNIATEKVTGRSRGELIDTDFSTYFTEPEKARAGYQQVFREGLVMDYALEIRRQDGYITPVLYNAAVYRDEAGNAIGVFAAARDITERKRAEEVTKLEEARNRSILKISQSPSASLGGLLDLALDEAIALTGSKIGYLYFYREDSRDFILHAWSKEVMNECTITSPQTVYQLDKTGIWGEVVRQRKPIMVNDFTAPHPLKKGYPEGHSKLYRFFSIPIFSDGRIVAVVGVANKAADYSEQDVRQLTLVMDSVWKIVERRQAEEEVRKLNRELESRVVERTAQLEASNKELEAFAYSVSHDLRTPLRGIDGFSLALLEDYADKLDESGRDYLQRVRSGALKMGQLIDALLNLSRLTRGEIRRATVDLSSLAKNAAEDLKKMEPARRVEFIIAEGLTVKGDAVMLRAAMDNLLANAWKFTGKRDAARIEFGMKKMNGKTAYFVRDNGAGFEMAYAKKLFTAFQRLHGTAEFPGLGIGLATVQRIIHRHGGQVWAEGEMDKGATFYFTLS